MPSEGLGVCQECGEPARQVYTVAGYGIYLFEGRYYWSGDKLRFCMRHAHEFRRRLDAAAARILPPLPTGG